MSEKKSFVEKLMPAVGKMQENIYVSSITGGMTSTTGLDAASSLSPTTYAATAYATVYPAALIGKIMATKIIMLLG